MKRKRSILFQWSLAAGILLLFVGGCGKKGPQPPVAPNARYRVYLTTDDGPMRGSGGIDEVIRQTRVPLTAFVVGKHAQLNPYRAYLERYRSNPDITLGNHSYSHANGHYLDYYRHPQRVLADFEKNQRLLRLPEKIGRLPGRDSWRIGGRAYDADRTATAAADLLADHGYTLYGWDLEWTHTQKGHPIGSGEEIYRRIKAQLTHGHTYTPGHLMLLMHDQMFGTAAARAELTTLIGLLERDPEIRLCSVDAYPETVPLHRSPGGEARLIRGVTTGVGETTPVDPLKFAH